MEIEPVINCDDFYCVKDRFLKANKFLTDSVKKIHIDISDGKYANKPKWNNPCDLKNFFDENKLAFYISVHFMFENPLPEIKKWSLLIKRAIIPLDSKENIEKIALFCRNENIIPSLSIPFYVPIEKVFQYGASFKEFQILAVTPGPSRQKMSEKTIERIKSLRNYFPLAIIEVDGGVNFETVGFLKEAGADIALSGSYIFDSKTPELAYLKLKNFK